MSELILKKVLCSERLPAQDGVYHTVETSGLTDYNTSTYFNNHVFRPNCDAYIVKYWYEEVSIKTELELQAKIDELILENSALKVMANEGYEKAIKIIDGLAEQGFNYGIGNLHSILTNTINLAAGL